MSLKKETILNKLSKQAARLTVELLIVFLGVYAAFELSEYQKGKEAHKYREQVTGAILTEMEEIVSRTERASENLPRVIEKLEKSISSGEMPGLVPLLEAVKTEPYMWNAAIESGAINSMNIEVMYKISSFYNSLNSGLEQINQLRKLSEDVLIPNLNNGAKEFYDLNTKQLSPKYQWYLQGLKNLSKISLSTTEIGRKLLKELKPKGDEL